MKNQHTDQNDACPLDELSPELRPVVERIAQETLPDGLVQRVLNGVLRQEATDPDGRPRPLERRRGRQTMPWSFAAAAAIGVATCSMILFAVFSFVLRVPNPEVVPQMPMAVNQDLPTAWAYHKAIAQSPEAIDALLAYHSDQVLPPEPKLFRVQIFPYPLQPMP